MIARIEGLASHLALTLPFFVLAGAPAQGAPVRVTWPGLHEERPLSGGGRAVYAVALEAGQHLYALVNQRGIDCVLRLSGPGHTERVVDDQANAQEVELLEFTTSEAGEYTLAIEPRDANAEAATYEVTIDLVDPSAPGGSARVEAFEAFHDAERLRLRGSPADRQAALAAFERALESWTALGDDWKRARALARVGYMQLQLGHPELAAPPLELARSLFRSIGDRRGEADAAVRLGSIYEQRGARAEAAAAYADGLKIFDSIGDRFRQAWSLLFLGGVLMETGDYDEALPRLGTAQHLFEDLGDRLGLGDSLNAQGVAYERLGRHQDALNCYQLALPITREIHDKLGEGLLLNNIGEIHRLLGDTAAALDSYRLAHERLSQVLDDPGVRGIDAIVVANIGRALEQLGDLEGALQHLTQALELSKQAGNRDAEGVAYQKLGWLYEKRGELKAALQAHEKAHELWEAISQNQRAADAIRCIGDVHFELGDIELALESYDQALPRQRKLGDRKAQAATLFGIARARLANGDLERARAAIEEAVEIIEFLRADVVSEELRASYLGSTRDYYELEVEILQRLDAKSPGRGLSAAALAVSERARARALLDTLAEAHAEIREGVDPELLKRERRSRQQLNLKAAEQARAAGGEQAAAAAVDKALAEYQAVEEQIRLSSPHYAALTQPQPLGADAIREQVLDPDSLLLEYWLAEKRSFLWAVTRDGVVSFTLPGRAVIEAAARSFLDEAQGQQLQLPGGGAPAAYRRAAAALGRIVLDPIAPLLRRHRLVFVPDGILHYVPFSALPVPHEKRFVPLVARYEIVRLPSASVLAELRREAAGRGAPDKMLAVLADPVFRADDPRVHATSGSPVASNGATRSAVMRSAEETGLAAFERLTESRQEATLIGTLVPAGKRLEALDFQASRGTATGEELQRYRFVHFATHGLLNSQHPELSGLVLSLVDPSGAPQDGFLRLHDVYNMRLTADLVVLSACQTALGKQIRGEGLVGLTRGFMYAGAPRVVASLWRVDDRATAELMHRFYRAMLDAGQTPAAALRAAQLSMWRDPQWSAPRNWAAFTIQGEWR